MSPMKKADRIAVRFCSSKGKARMTGGKIAVKETREGHF